MKAEELRTGNLVLKNNLVVTITGRIIFDIYGMNSHNVKDSGYKPIPLTEELLNKMGWNMKKSFEGNTDKVIELEGYKDGYCITWEKYVTGIPIRFAFWTTLLHNKKKHDACICSLYFVHQLQNLFFALECKELTLD